MRVFLTGATGFIGKCTLEELKKCGHRVLALSRRTHRERGVDFIKGDLANIVKWKGRLKKFKPQAAVHLAWEGIPDFSYERSVKNLEEGIALFSALAGVGCKKIVAAGSGFECGNRTGKISDAIPVAPYNSFTAAKHSLHLMGEALAREHEMDFIWLRPYNPYGNGQRPGSLIPYIMRTVEGEIPLRLKNPFAQGDFVYISDVAKMFADAIARGKGIATYNLGSGYLTPVREIARIVCKEIGASEEYCKDFARTTKGKFQPAAYADISRVRKDLGWRPKVDMAEGIKKTVKEFLSSNY
ncbi:MAG: NAD(P)-dependent oxidoreductase [Patescibacteria group bacterium]